MSAPVDPQSGSVSLASEPERPTNATAAAASAATLATEAAASSPSSASFSPAMSLAVTDSAAAAAASAATLVDTATGGATASSPSSASSSPALSLAAPESGLLRASSADASLDAPFDPARASTPRTNAANSPVQHASQGLDHSHAGATGSAAASSSSSAVAYASPSASASAAFPHRPTALPILSLPALPGQRVCGCMRAVSQAHSALAIVPTSPATAAAAESGTAAVAAALASPGLAASSSPSSPPSLLGSAGSASSLSSSAPFGSTLESLLCLQDRFWLSVGEVALHNDDCSVERGVDSIESVFVKLAHLSQQLTHQMRLLHDDQIAGVQSVMVEMELKNRELVDYLRLTRGEEAAVRERIDILAGEVEKAKKTVKMGANLSLHSSKQARERTHLESVRSLRDAAQKQLETIVSARTLAQNQMLNVGTIVSECRRTEMDRRDYKALYQQVQNAFFLRSFGAAYQIQMANLVKALSRLRDISHECARRKKRVEHTQNELRGRIAMVVAAYWK